MNLRRVALAVLLFVPLHGFAQEEGFPLIAAGLMEGRDYAVIDGGAPFEPHAGQVEVAEVFSYACPACNTFNPKLAAWKKSLPAYAHLVYVPADFRPDFVPYAHAYYAAESLGLVDKAHDAVYAAIHGTHVLRGEGQPEDAGTIARFYAQFGAKADEFQKRMESAEISAKTAKAHQFAMRSKVTGTPSLIVAGKYRVNGRTYTELLDNAARLVEKAHAGP